ncbi:MAG: hypothetical protein AABZ13_10805 [Planctomycetota bacterium]
MSRKFLGCLCCVIVISFAFGCATTVNLTLKNIEDFPQQARITTKDQHGIKENEIEVGVIAAKQAKAIAPFEVKNGGQFQVVSMVPNSGIIFDSPRSVSGNEDPLNVAMDIFAAIGSKLDDSKSLQMISDSFKKLGPDLGVYPMKLSEVIKTRFGALLVIPAGEKPNEPLFTITPAQLGVKEVKLEEVMAAYNATKESNSTKISGSASAQAKSSVPLYGTFGFSFDTNSVYEVAWTLEGFGVIPKVEDPNMHYIKALNQLSSEIKAQLLKVLKDNKGSKLIYVNNMYAIKRASLSVKEGTKVSTGLNANVSNVVTASGVYTFSTSKEMTKDYEAFVLNYWGDEISYSIDKVGTAKNVVIAQSLGTHEILSFTSSKKSFDLKPYSFGDLKSADLSKF